MLRGLCTGARRRVIVTVAAVSVLAVPAAAEGATFWTIRPDVRDPLLWVGLSPAPAFNDASGPLFAPVLAVPTAGALDQHWSIARSSHGYKLVNRQSGRCLAGSVGEGRTKSEVERSKMGKTYLAACNEFGTYRFVQFNFHQPGRPAPMRSLTSGVVYQIRGSIRKGGEETFGRCLAVRYSFFQPGGNLVMQPCNRGTANQRFQLKSFSE